MKILVKKRDGRIVKFDETRIQNAIQKCINKTKPDSQINVDKIVKSIKEKYNSDLDSEYIISVEQIQDDVEKNLMQQDPDLAKSYILYREKRSNSRDFNSNLTRTLKKMMTSSAKDMNLMRENANINADVSMGIMLKTGSEASKDFSLKYLIKPEYAELHKNGDIHIHDLDFYPICFNCCQIPLGKLLKTGFNTGHGHVNQPHSIITASALACIILQSNQNEMYGGQSFPCWEYDLAPYVAKTFAKKIVDEICDLLVFEDESDFEIRQCLPLEKFDTIYEKHNTIFSNEAQSEIRNFLNDTTLNLSDEDITKVLSRAKFYTERDVAQAMKAVIHNLNTMQSRAGAQVPFSCLNYGTGTSIEQRMIIKNLLLETEKGLGGGETPIFPVQIFKLKDGVNTKKGDPNFDLFELACRVSAKRLFPNFSFIDSPYNLQYYKPGHPETEVAIMGCRTRTIGNYYDPDHEICPGRGNIFFTTINLPRLGIEANHNINKFFEMFDQRITQCFEQNIERFNLISHKHAYNFPFLMGEGVYIGSEKLNPEDEIAEVLKQGSLAVGFIGLAECLVALTGKHHGESEQSRQLGLKIIQHLRDRCDEECKQTGLTWACFATPAEGLSGRFVKMDAERFGKIPGITDREYYTNSFHIPVYFNIKMFEKIKIEAPYHEICNGGSISYVEMDGDPTKNVKAFEAVVQYAKQNNMCYFSINHPVDMCPVCGYVGVIGEECPRCGFKEGEGVSEETLINRGVSLSKLICKC